MNSQTSKICKPHNHAVTIHISKRTKGMLDMAHPTAVKTTLVVNGYTCYTLTMSPTTNFHQDTVIDVIIATAIFHEICTVLTSHHIETSIFIGTLSMHS